MYTGIVHGLYPIVACESHNELYHCVVELDKTIVNDLMVGQSVAINGVCLTVAALDGIRVHFNIINETLDKTTLANLKQGQLVNVERSLRVGDELGGHMLSGHVFGRGQICHREEIEGNLQLTIACQSDWLAMILPKGFIAVNGVSLTVGKVCNDGNHVKFNVHLIPESRQRSTLGSVQVGDEVNIELDQQTQVIVKSVERILKNERANIL